MKHIFHGIGTPLITAVLLTNPVRASEVDAGIDTIAPGPARLAALTTPLEDSDLGWLAPLLRAQAADMARDRTRSGAVTATIRQELAPDAGEARVEGIRSGRLNAMDLIRAHSSQARLPASARYHAACSAGLTEGLGGLQVMAAFTGVTVEEARAFYRSADFEWSGYEGAGYRAISPDRRVWVNLTRGTEALDVRKLLSSDIAASYPHLRPCAGIPGVLLIVRSEGELATRLDAAADAAAPAAGGLSGALGRAGLSAEQWDRMMNILLEAATDGMYSASPASLDQVAGSVAEGNRRRANVRWYVRNRAAVDALLGPIMNGGG